MMPLGSLLVLWGFLAVVSTAPTQIGSDFSTDQDRPCTSSRNGICWKKKCPFGQAYFDQSALACICPDAPDRMVCQAQSYFKGALTSISSRSTWINLVYPPVPESAPRRNVCLVGRTLTMNYCHVSAVTLRMFW
jgi:hypothetical protein